MAQFPRPATAAGGLAPFLRAGAVPAFPVPPFPVPRSALMTAPLPRVRAPEFPASLDWINTGGRPLALADLRGRVTLLDFWTYG